MNGFAKKHRQVKRNGFHSGSSPELPFDLLVKIKKSEEIKMKQQEITLEEKWDKLLEIGVEEQTLQVVTDINGFNHETLEDILYCITGYRDFNELQ